MKRIIFFLFYFLQLTVAQEADVNPELLNRQWPAWWITVSNAPENEYGVYHFRKTIEIAQKPEKFVVHVSADNRYKLYVNGEMVSLGPARGDIYNWIFETVDIAPYLKAGKNTLAAVVWYFASYAPAAQISFGKTGFILQGDSEMEQIANTNSSWKGIRNESYSPIKVDLRSFFVVGPGDRLEASKYPWDWEQPGFDDSSWDFVSQTVQGGGKGTRNFFEHQLVPRSIPQMEHSYERIVSLRRIEGMDNLTGFPQKPGNYTIPPKSKVSFLLDQTHLTTAYLNLVFSKGRNAEINIRYAEALYNVLPKVKDGNDHDKGNRNEIDGKIFFGYNDCIIADGEEKRKFTSLWWRTYRYILIDVETFAEPLVLHDIFGTYTGYPFKLASGFSAPEMPVLDKILEVGWRTARLCAHETYMDCPYYEQLQYFGDTRIQAMVSLYNTRDDRLIQNAINHGRQSIVSDGILMSRYPTNRFQFIPSFSIWWIGIIYDYWMHRGNKEFVADQLPYIRNILNYYEKRLRVDTSLSYIHYWFFTDWAEGFDFAEPPRMADGQSSIQDLHYLTGLQLAAELEKSVGMTSFADHYEKIASDIKKGFREKYWDNHRKLFADTPERKTFSQHANILAILTEIVEGEQAKFLMDNLLVGKDLTMASIYFRYYLNMALHKTGMGDRYLDMLDVWHNQLANGLTTWAESPEPARSDCHAWGSSPNIELYRIVLGIKPASPGFEKVLIEPNLGKLNKVSGYIPHPKGTIHVELQKNSNGGVEAEISLPADVSGKFIWNGIEKELMAGKHLIKIEP